jgi:hypothetical protein
MILDASVFFARRCYGRMIGEVCVELADELKIAWGLVLEDIHRLSISFAYDNPKRILRTLKTSKISSNLPGCSESGYRLS